MKYLADCGQPTPSRSEQARLRRYSVRVSKHRPLPGRAPFSLPPSAHSAKRTGGKHPWGKSDHPWANRTIPWANRTIRRPNPPKIKSLHLVPSAYSLIFACFLELRGAAPRGASFAHAAQRGARPCSANASYGPSSYPEGSHGGGLPHGGGASAARLRRSRAPRRAFGALGKSDHRWANRTMPLPESTKKQHSGHGPKCIFLDFCALF